MQKNKLHVVLLSRYFPPEIGTAANLFHELATQLSLMEHRVTVLTSFPWYNLDKIPDKYTGKIFMREKIRPNFEVIRFKIPLVGPVKLKLALGHLTGPIASLIAGLFVQKPDIIFCYSPPLPMGVAGYLLGKIKTVGLILGVQDLHPQCYIDQGVLKNRFLIQTLEYLEFFCYQKSSAITVHSQGNKYHITSKKVIKDSKVKVIPNWIDTDELKPLPRKNIFSEKHDLNDKFVVGYAGTLGMSQGLMSIIDSAIILKDHKDILFFIVGDGIEKREMVRKTEKFKLNNIRFIGMQPKNIYPLVVASSDVQLVTLNKKVATPVVPSKILSIMAAERPVLASMPMKGDAPRLIDESGCGICIPAENPEMLSQKILYLFSHPEKCREFSRAGFKYVNKNFSLKVISKQIERVLVEHANKP